MPTIMYHQLHRVSSPVPGSVARSRVGARGIRASRCGGPRGLPSTVVPPSPSAGAAAEGAPQGRDGPRSTPPCHANCSVRGRGGGGGGDGDDDEEEEEDDDASRRHPVTTTTVKMTPPPHFLQKSTCESISARSSVLAASRSLLPSLAVSGSSRINSSLSSYKPLWISGKMVR
jgi:hypothetical protein